ncbi:MAG: rubredoxin [Desulfatitalea sp.]|nr:rubredoxin [Desulfatitalea sp.]NNK00101.1 rubredoxin [Desulfatitalea sp.]
MKQWQCTVCGYIHRGESPPDKCPVCGADKSQFILVEETPAQDPVAVSTGAAAPQPEGVAGKWRCTVCGYIHTGSEPPEKCPVCGADRNRFERLSEAPAETKNEQEAGEAKPASSPDRPKRMPRVAKLPAFTQVMTQYHDHPIAVHIPNGLLPVSFLFTLAALSFSSHGFAVAAKYNLIFVCIFMPVVIGTGYIDWVHRFGGRMTRVFKTKMVCAGIVATLSLLLSIWWLISPDLYLNGLSGNILFALLNLANLTVAAIAGWYGGKLVFK